MLKSETNEFGLLLLLFTPVISELLMDWTIDVGLSVRLYATSSGYIGGFGKCTLYNMQNILSIYKTPI